MTNIQVNWNKLFSNKHFQQGWGEVLAGIGRADDIDSHEYALGRCFAIESGLPFPRYSGELPAVLARCPAGVAEMDGSLRRILDDMVRQSIDGFVCLARELLELPHTGSVTAGDTEHAGFRIRGRRR